jgi:hypothetical protein
MIIQGILKFNLKRFWDIVIFPKNKLEKMISKIVESSMPSMQYFVWNPMTYWARKSGWTEQEKLYHNFFRGDFIMYQTITQAMHPQAFLERQRADAFMRRVETFLPGVECPEWAQHHRRAVDFDYEGMLNPIRAQDLIMQEATPKPHYGNNYPSSLLHWGNWRFIAGFWAKRLFYNEEIKGNIKDGQYSKSKLKQIDSWYADTQERHILLQNEMSPQEIDERIQNAEKWIKNIDTFFPEYQNYKLPTIVSKISEPYFLRNLQNVLDSIFTQKWMNALNTEVFTSDEIQNIYEFYLQQRDDVFFQLNSEDGLYSATPLYLKFVETMCVPNIFELEKYTSMVVEEQYSDLQQSKYHVSIETVENFSSTYRKFVKQLPVFENGVLYKNALDSISEEVYSPLFKLKLEQLIGESVNGSLVAHYLNLKGADGLSDLKSITHECNEEMHIISREVKENFFLRVRNIVKTFPFKSQSVPEVKF